MLILWNTPSWLVYYQNRSTTQLPGGIEISFHVHGLTRPTDRFFSSPKVMKFPRPASVTVCWIRSTSHDVMTSASERQVKYSSNTSCSYREIIHIVCAQFCFGSTDPNWQVYLFSVQAVDGRYCFPPLGGSRERNESASSSGNNRQPSIMYDVTVVYENFGLIHSDKLIEHLVQSTTTVNNTGEYGNWIAIRVASFDY